MTIDDLLFVGFNRRVAALDKETGEVVWRWKAPHGTGFVTLLVENERVYASVNGYTYCLDAPTGAQLWYNELGGFGTGVACLATTSGASTAAHLGAAAADASRQSAAASGAGAS